jgi:hypothetical protein
MDFTIIKVNHLIHMGQTLLQPGRRLASYGSPPLYLRCIEVNKKPGCPNFSFQATRLSRSKTRGFPSPSHGGFGFAWLIIYFSIKKLIHRFILSIGKNTYFTQ